VAQVEFGVMAQYVRSLPPGLPTVLVVHDLAQGSPLITGDADLGDRLRERLDRRAWARFERDAFGGADVAVVFSERDGRLVRAVTPRPRVEVIPLGIRLAAPLDPEGTEQAVVFVGSFVHPPNVDAARFLVTEILPHVRSAVPEVTAYVVGDAPPPAIRELAGDGVVVTGRVASVEPYLERAAVVVAPVRLGGGMRVKVLDALGAGKALVATPLGVSGLGIEDGVHALVREGSAPLGQAIAALLRDPGRRRALGTSARAWAAGSSWEATAEAYERVYASLAPSAGHGTVTTRVA
jgi:glycosyltransferase involved in cell wall biosynthesis